MRISTTPVPRAGDVAVTRESRSAVWYGLRQFPGTVQLGASSREEAVRLARTFAEAHAVDLWFSEDGTDVLLDAYRPTTVRRLRLREEAGPPARGIEGAPAAPISEGRS